MHPRGRPAADRGAAGRSRRGGPGHRLRPRVGPRLRQAHPRGHRRGRRRSCSPTTRARPRRSSEFADADRPLDGRGPDGLRGRRHPPAGGRRLRHEHLDPAVLRPGRRPFRPRPQAGRDRVGVPALRADPDGPRGRDGGRARPRARPPPREDGARRPAARTRPSRPRSSPTPSATSCRSRRWRRRATFDRVLFDGGEFGTRRRAGLRRGGGLPRPSRPAGARPGALLLQQAAGRPASAKRKTKPRSAGRRARTRAARADRRRSARSSTAWSARGTTAPASRTASSTPSCAGPVAARPSRRPPPSRSASGSPRSASGPPSASDPARPSPPLTGRRGTSSVSVGRGSRHRSVLVQADLGRQAIQSLEDGLEHRRVGRRHPVHLPAESRRRVRSGRRPGR